MFKLYNIFWPSNFYILEGWYIVLVSLIGGFNILIDCCRIYNKPISKDNKNDRFIESGDIFFFYRPKIDTEEVKDIEDVLDKCRWSWDTWLWKDITFANWC